jgi:hypothetical protein
MKLLHALGAKVLDMSTVVDDRKIHETLTRLNDGHIRELVH